LILWGMLYLSNDQMVIWAFDHMVG